MLSVRCANVPLAYAVGLWDFVVVGFCVWLLLGFVCGCCWVLCVVVVGFCVWLLLF